MVKKVVEYIPDGGDVVWLTLDPTLGHEQYGRRPALVISPKSYNQKTGLALFCPITTKAKGYPFEVSLTSLKGVEGVILADQIKNLDWQARKIKLIRKVSIDVLKLVQDMISILIKN